ncbi:Hypothetical predicted protein [Podarcis lilfordi]|uniref:Uncharacterized protein n=1 Tax=Podarcis lilfordi TaxID=74358 RepID=A0AA35PKU8_9SAUR|nr:Hypothetical predicted protein [Podarcis lilfordi]
MGLIQSVEILMTWKKNGPSTAQSQEPESLFDSDLFHVERSYSKNIIIVERMDPVALTKLTNVGRIRHSGKAGLSPAACQRRQDLNLATKTFATIKSISVVSGREKERVFRKLPERKTELNQN